MKPVYQIVILPWVCCRCQLLFVELLFGPEARPPVLSLVSAAAAAQKETRWYPM